ncbi:MAG: AraC family transcriptional regulator [Bacteroidales bacterium]|nr:AraC family transcriptional regulator [Bacteroidales bacterium]
MNALYLIGFVQSIFFIVLILTKRKKQLKDYLLSGYILILGLNLIFMYWMETGFHDTNPLVIILDFAYWVLLGPLLFLYIEITTAKKPKLKWIHLIHLFPLVFILIAFSDYFRTGLNSSFFNYRSNSPLFIAGYLVWMYNSPIYYIILIFKLRKHRRNIKTYFSTPKNVDLKWLNYLLHGFAVFLFFLLFSGLIIRLLKLEVTLNSYHFTWLIMVIYIFGIGFYGYKQKGIFSEFEIKNNEEPIDEKIKETEQNLRSNNRQYLKTGLHDEEALIIQKQLELIMKRDKPYLDYEITLPKLANLLNTSSHKLSQVINEKYNTNFFEFVNCFRLNDLKILLTKTENAEIKIMALAYDCGFNSKSAFYTFFKKETSLTPTEYRNKQLATVEV